MSYFNIVIFVLLNSIIISTTTTTYTSKASLQNTNEILDVTKRDGGTTTSDNFLVQMCRERIHRLDYKYIVKPCVRNLPFGTHIYHKELRTKPTLTQIPIKEIRDSGEYSTFKIKTFDKTGRPKTFGGDSFRVFVNGTAGSLEPIIYDLNNGEYEVAFLVLDPGVYTVSVTLEGSLCSSYVNPPGNWFKKGSKSFIIID